MPNDSINDQVKASLSEILPKLVKMMPYLPTSVIIFLFLHLHNLYFHIDRHVAKSLYRQVRSRNRVYFSLL